MKGGDPRGPGGRQFLTQRPERCQRIRSARTKQIVAIHVNASVQSTAAMRTQRHFIRAGRVLRHENSLQPLRTNSSVVSPVIREHRGRARPRVDRAKRITKTRARREAQRPGRSDARAAISVASNSTMRVTTPKTIAMSARLKSGSASTFVEPR